MYFLLIVMCLGFLFLTVFFAGKYASLLCLVEDIKADNFRLRTNVSNQEILIEKQKIFDRENQRLREKIIKMEGGEEHEKNSCTKLITNELGFITRVQRT